MDIGVIAARKTRYRGLLLRFIVKGIETRKSQRDQYDSVQSRMRRLAESFDSDLLDVAEMVSVSWKEIS